MNGTPQKPGRPGLPMFPDTCAICGATDWRVVMTDTDRRKMHVSCSSLAGNRPTTPQAAP